MMRRFLLCMTVMAFLPALCMANMARQKSTSRDSYLQIVVHKYSLKNVNYPRVIFGALHNRMSQTYKSPQGQEWKATRHGLLKIGSKGRGEKVLTGRNGLPILDVTGITGGPDGWLWLASNQGVMLLVPHAMSGQRWFYFWGKRYLSDNRVLGIVAGKHKVWIRTQTGISLVSFRPFTLRRKSALFLRRIRERHDRYGYVADCQLLRPGDTSLFRMEPTDNDGLWTAIFVAAESFRYATTHSKEALKDARTSLTALLQLDTITGIHGYPARALIHRGDYRPSGGTWHWTANGKWEWKGDTSSDELVGHFFAYWVAYHLLPDDGDRAVIRSHVASIADGLLKHHLDLVGYGGRVTTWGKYNPRYLQTLNNRDRALNSLELLSHLRVAYAITGERKFLKAYRRIGGKLGYVQNVMRIGDDSNPSNINYSDEELAFLSFYPLLNSGHRVRWRDRFQEALTQLWQRVRSEHNPLWDFIYRQDTGKEKYDCAEALETLQQIPLSTITWTVDNSQRKDLKLASHLGRHGEMQSMTAIPPDERRVMKWNADPFQLNGGDGGRREDDGSFFLLPYWFGSYYRLIPCAQ